MKDQLDAVMEIAFARGEKELVDDGFFHPFCVTLHRREGIQLSAPLTEAEQALDPELLVAQLNGTLHMTVRDDVLIDCAALVTQVKFLHPGSGRYEPAIAVHLEHRSGQAWDCFLPFQKRAEGYTFEAPVGTASTLAFFTP